jgi:hypothetical protein
MIVHEDTLISQRVSFQLLTQSFLITAAVILANNTWLSHVVQGIGLLLMGAAGITLGVLFYSAVKAARQEQKRLRGEEQPDDNKPSYDEVFPLSAAEGEPVVATEDALKSRLQSCGVTLFRGFSYVHWVQWCMTTLWVPIMLVGLLDCVCPQVIRATSCSSGNSQPMVVLLDPSRGFVITLDPDNRRVVSEPLPRNPVEDVTALLHSMNKQPTTTSPTP